MHTYLNIRDVRDLQIHNAVKTYCISSDYELIANLLPVDESDFAEWSAQSSEQGMIYFFGNILATF